MNLTAAHSVHVHSILHNSGVRQLHGMDQGNLSLSVKFKSTFRINKFYQYCGVVQLFCQKSEKLKRPLNH